MKLISNALQELKQMENKYFHVFKSIRNLNTAKIIYEDDLLEGFGFFHGN